MRTQMEYRQLHELYWVIVPIAIIVIAYMGYVKKSKIMNWLELKQDKRIVLVKGATLVLGIMLIFYALLGPEKEIGSREITGEGLDVYILIDTSKSMLAEDILPSRIMRSKKIIDELLSGLKGDRVGFIPYASSAYIQMPLTNDYDLARMYLNVIDTDMVGGGGTDVAEALQLARDSFNQSKANNQMVLILSDGEEEDADYDKMKKVIGDSQMKVFTIGIGTKEGALIPIYDGSGKKISAYKKDDQGELVMTKLNEDLLSQLATYSGGEYYRSDNSLTEVVNLTTTMSMLDKGATTARKVKEYQAYFQWFLGLGLLFLFISFILPDRRKDL